MNNYIQPTANSQQPTSAKVRESNLELFRIITMLLIVAHHYVVNSGLLIPIRAEPFANQSIFLLLFGAWGKTGINCFLLITGFFVCKSNITLRKFLKLLFQIEFYNILIFLIFAFTGYLNLNKFSDWASIFPIWDINKNFISCFLVFYLFIPFLNILINNMNQKQHRNLLYFVSLFYIIMGSLPKFTLTFNYVTWFCILYFIGSYIRLYPLQIFENNKNRSILFIGSILLSSLSIILFNYIRFKYGKMTEFFLVADSNKILAVFTSISAFIYFKYLKFPYNRFINYIASTTFGVLCIHANSDAMRQWLWKDYLNNVGQYGTDNLYIHAFLSVICIFAICSLIDFIRIKIFEQPLFKYIDKKL